MMTGGVFAQNDILGAAMQAAVVRDSVMSNNIANAETPNYKKYGVAFEEYLQKSVDNYKKTGVLDLSKAAPTVTRIHKNLSSRLDGNNVDVNEENVNLYQNSVVYDGLVNSVVSNYRLLNLVFSMK